jgi:hypothetical protein
MDLAPTQASDTASIRLSPSGPAPTSATTPATVAPATNQSLGTQAVTTAVGPAPPPLPASGNVMVIVVSGAGSNTLALTGLRCTSTAVTGQVQGGGTVRLDLSAALLQLQEVATIGSPRFSGSIEQQGSRLQFKGTRAEASVALRATC